MASVRKVSYKYGEEKRVLHESVRRKGMRVSINYKWKTEVLIQ
jgi:hypothetical protein